MRAAAARTFGAAARRHADTRSHGCPACGSDRANRLDGAAARQWGLALCRRPRCHAGPVRRQRGNFEIHGRMRTRDPPDQVMAPGSGRFGCDDDDDHHDRSGANPASLRRQRHRGANCRDPCTPRPDTRRHHLHARQACRKRAGHADPLSAKLAGDRARGRGLPLKLATPNRTVDTAAQAWFARAWQDVRSDVTGILARPRASRKPGLINGLPHNFASQAYDYDSE